MRVRCTTDNHEFKSMSEADKYYGFYEGKVSELCRSRQAFQGLSFEKVDDVFSKLPSKSAYSKLQDNREYDLFTASEKLRCGDCFLDEGNHLYMFVQRDNEDLQCMDLNHRRLKTIKLTSDKFVNKVNYQILLND